MFRGRYGKRLLLDYIKGDVIVRTKPSYEAV